MTDGRVALIVVGMHRSGTSAMARALSLLGAALPRDMIPGNPTNPTGHWEPADVAVLNDELLAEMGTNWASLFGPDRDGRVGDDRRQATARRIVRAQYGDAPLIVMKEPRTSLLADFWDEALRAEGYDCRYVVMVRHPDEVAASLLARDDLNRAQSYLIWTAYMAYADLLTRSMKRIFVRYDDLLASPGTVLDTVTKKLCNELSPRSPEIDDALADFLDPSLRHHRARRAPKADEAFAPVGRLYRHCLALARGKHPGDDAATAASEWLLTLKAICLPLMQRQALDFSREQTALRDTIAGLQASLARAGAIGVGGQEVEAAESNRQTEAIIARIDTAFAERGAMLRQMHQDISDLCGALDQKIDGVRAEGATSARIVQERVAAGTLEEGKLVARLEDAEAARQAAVTAADKAREALVGRDRQIDVLHKMLAAAKREIAEIEAGIQARELKADRDAVARSGLEREIELLKDTLSKNLRQMQHDGYSTIASR